MNFSLTALTLALTTPLTAATQKIRLSNLRVNSSSDPALSRALLSKASPYGRRAQDNNNAAAALDGSYSLKFSSCVDVKLYDDEFANSEYADQIAAGTVTPTKSYVIFHVCTDQTCEYEGVDDLYIVDLASYLGTVATYHAEKSGKYCEACAEFEDVCNVQEEGDDAVAEEEGEGDEGAEEEGAEDNVEEDQGEEENREEEEPEEEDPEEEDPEEEDREEGEGEGRKLKRTSRRTSKVAINCNKCLANNCYAEQEEGAVNLDEQAAEWIKKVSECEMAEIQVNGANVYYGAMCDDYGDGVELAVFLDEKCSLYTSNVAFNNVFMKEEGNDGYSYLTYAENYIKTAFQDVMSCDEPQYYVAGDDDAAAAAEEDNAEMNEYCQGILKDDALSYTNCEADEDAQQLVTEDGYAYDLAYGDDLDIQEVCAVVKRMENAGGDYFHAYDSSTSGTWYKRDKKGQIIVESQSSGGLSGGAIFGIIAAIAAVVGGAAFFVMKKKEKKGDIAESAEYQGGALS